MTFLDPFDVEFLANLEAVLLAQGSGQDDLALGGNDGDHET
jgi:hypothetical protein